MTPHGAPEQWSTRRRAAPLLVGLAGAAVLAAPWLLEALGTGRLPLVAGVVAWRNLLTVAAWVLAGGIALFLFSRRHRRVAAALLLPVGMLALAGTLVASVPPRQAAPAMADTARRLVILSWNINGSLASPDVIAHETTEHNPDVLVLPAVDPGVYLRLKQLLAPRGYSPVHPAGSETAIFSRVGYRPADDGVHGPDPSREAIAINGASGFPTLVAVHLAIPFLPAGNGAWNREVDWLGGLCASDDPFLIVGDFNATDDNLAGTRVTRCADAAAASGAAQVGTWPTSLIPQLAMPIDHVLIGGRRSSAIGFAVLTDQDHSGALHRPILATVALP
jgi:endonuclease/exonuclease/phosphatase (EEP) superfamily protein YafD